MSKKSLLIINKAQFGYHTDSFKYCQYLKNEFDITYLCFDTDKKKIVEEGINVIYVPHEGSFFKKGISFIRFCRNYIKSSQVDFVFVVYFQMASLLRLGLSSYASILDIRTGAVGQTVKKRKIDNTLLRFESKAFKHITIISESLRDKLKLESEKCHILPLGSDELSKTDKSFKAMNLLYVGTLSSRNIEETVYGLADFIKKYDFKEPDITYDIFGSGTIQEEELLRKTISETGMEGIVKFHGRKTHKELKYYFDNCNIGVNYIPLVDYYECQPPTKLFEYIKAGLLCIATSTYENKRFITEKNGILCDDSAGSFSDALEDVYVSRKKFDSQLIRRSLIDYNWENIVNYNLKNYLNDKVV